MNFNFPFLRPIRILLFPLSFLYYGVIYLRNFFYDKKLLPAASFNLPLICVGNLAVGGTGKSPMVEYLVRQLKNQFVLATLSRGYMRKTKGYALANHNSNALEIGDEPMQFHLKFPTVAVAVGEERLEAIPQLLHDRPATQAIILDDAFQHRKVTAGFNIILTDYSNLFTKDWYLPTGDLRDEKRSAQRAQVFIVTKCPATLLINEKQKITTEINPLPHQQVYFSTIKYGHPYHLKKGEHVTIDKHTEVLLVTGIANPAPLKNWLHECSKTYYQQAYSDHHIFTIDDLKEIIQRFEEIPHHNKIILTTEKDAVRLVKFQHELDALPFYVLPIEMEFLFEEGPQFNQQVENFITNFKQSPLV
ncbi:MAG: tetraacyldisaccharide 4'-kinase [Sphingobacteriales bacterium]|nr:MAG: tetraacyldisaccharide 4'-kinase [Sphingobacteriales bacterium]